MKILRPATAAAALGTILLLGACSAGHPALPAPAPYTVPSVPATGSPSPSPKDPASNPAPPPTVAPPAVPAPPRTVAPRAPAPVMRPPVPAPRRVVPPAPRPMVAPPARVPAGNDHDADNNGGPDDGDGNK